VSFYQVNSAKKNFKMGQQMDDNAIQQLVEEFTQTTTDYRESDVYVAIMEHLNDSLDLPDVMQLEKHVLELKNLSIDKQRKISFDDVTMDILNWLQQGKRSTEDIFSVLILMKDPAVSYVQGNIDLKTMKQEWLNEKLKKNPNAAAISLDRINKFEVTALERFFEAIESGGVKSEGIEKLFLLFGNLLMNDDEINGFVRRMASFNDAIIFLSMKKAEKFLESRIDEAMIEQMVFCYMKLISFGWTIEGFEKILTYEER